MSNVIKVNFLKHRTPSSLLGLSLDGSRLEGVVVKRSNGSLSVAQKFSATLSLDPLTNDAELVGREILNQLEAAGIRGRRCVVALPLKWALAAHVAIPKMPDADVASFLQLEAERGFPTDINTLQVATSRLTSSAGEQHATFIGIPKGHVERLEQVLRAAKLKPATLSLGITALQPPGEEGVLALLIGEHHVGLQITCGGGVAALRALEGAVTTEGSARNLHADLIAREARITLGQLPADLRDCVKRVRIFGPRQEAETLAEEIRRRFESGGLKVEIVTAYSVNEFGRTLPADTLVSPALSLAARQIAGRADPFEFLPPKVSAWQRATSKYAPDKMRKIIAVAGAVVLIIIGLFGYQQWQLTTLGSKWKEMQPEVKRLTAVDEQKQKYQPWFDESKSFRYLTALKTLAMAFPENGSLTAKTVDIHDLNDSREEQPTRGVSVVSCSGTAQSMTALQATIHDLNTNKLVSDTLPVPRGAKSPIQFTLDFHVNPAGRTE